MAFTVKDVQALREKTGCGMMDCKKALSSCDGDMEKAIEILREKGLAVAAKKAGRVTAEGLVCAMVEGNVGTIIEVNSETDFVAKNKDFQDFVNQLAQVVSKENPADMDAFIKMKYDDKLTVEEALREKILTIGENIQIRRFERLEGSVVSYVHSGGRIGVLVLFNADESVAKNPGFSEIGKDIAMQVAALNPLYLNRDLVPQSVIDNEREILFAQIKNDPKMASKPDNIITKMIDGRVGKYYENNCLVDQEYVKDPSLTVAKYIEQKGKEFGGKLEIAKFVRFERGEGIQKKEENLAEEIAKIIK